ncbi:sugar phosphate nucleotidyltransferase [Desulfatirhabdium butyrativorans]|uniref:sugar phosphate nucleotidyltransferase n=1 Tax=Desulfatirhabdium butyrativorans TaxID=340467 RepID=UPI00146FB7AF|nr:sugar phosphate nucleotidyltransferase [Desulfatirhabdium butyrativorans]
MIAMILAAGYGKRLQPYSLATPKPLFPIAGRPILDHILHRLEAAGCTAAIINTHHLADQIKQFIEGNTYRMPVHLIHEPEILGTAGAIRNAAAFFDAEPFLVINADIFTDIDLASVYKAHLQNGALATMVLIDWPEINTVRVDDGGWVRGFAAADEPYGGDFQSATFSGIQVLDPKVLSWIPQGSFLDSVTLYRRLIDSGMPPRAWFPPRPFVWDDLGSIARYRRVAREQMAAMAFQKTFGCLSASDIRIEPLAGDGSDRAWFRLKSGQQSLVMVDHGLADPNMTCPEAQSFISIGAHLYSKGIPVARQHAADMFSGLVVMDDLGDDHLQRIVSQEAPERAAEWYDRIIAILVRYGLDTAADFDPSWAWQSTHYDEGLILEKECQYFQAAFLEGWLGMSALSETLETEFRRLAANTMENACMGLIHRDMQSRNILISRGKPFVIDYQASRFGPVQYDLASLAIDPYVSLPQPLRDSLPDRYLHAARPIHSLDPKKFRRGFELCCITRNLQILGAFAYLSKIKGKPFFAAFLAPALDSLELNLQRFAATDYPVLLETVQEAKRKMRNL